MRFLLTSLLCCLVSLVQAQAQSQQNLPPAYPREGASKLLENEDVIVWEISWLNREYPVHRHRYPHTGVYYSSGDRIITSEGGEARDVHTDAWNISFQPAGVTHTETGVSDEPLRAVFVQIKRPVAEHARLESDLPLYPQDGPLDRRANERIQVWEYNEQVSGIADELHRHGHDAVVVWFDGDKRPNVHFIARDSVHYQEIPSAAVRVFVFEIL
jgi:hypothetical protein